MTRRADIEERLLEMKNMSELMIDLAYSAVLFDSEEIAQEVQDLEDAQDRRYAQLQRDLLQAVKANEIDPEVALALGGLAIATENVADAARDIADVVLRDVEPHPVLKVSMGEADAIITRLVVDHGAPIDGVTLGDAKVQTDTGMLVFAIRRGDSWILGPSADVAPSASDVLLARGPEEGVEKLRALVAAPGAKE